MSHPFNKSNPLVSQLLSTVFHNKQLVGESFEQVTQPTGHFPIDTTKSEIPQDSLVAASLSVVYIMTIKVGAVCSIVILIGTITSFQWVVDTPHSYSP